MKRTAKIIRYSKDRKRAICIDTENWAEIFEYINRDSQTKKKFNHISSLILEGLKNADLYDKEEINNKCKGVTAMKLFKGRSNDRIYCKEVTLENRTFIVIAAELFEKKKSQKINQKTRNVIEKVGSYEYEITD